MAEDVRIHHLSVVRAGQADVDPDDPRHLVR